MRAALSLFAALALVGCGAETMDEHPCPPQSGPERLTYQSFGQDFFRSYCVRCHGGPNGYSSRAFTTVESIRGDRERIYVNAAGPNTTMPPGPDDPPESERKKLADWLACGAP